MKNTGIYIIKNITNNKFYIGSSSRNIYKRFINHKSRLNRNIHHNKYLQNSWNKYGEDNFIFEILEICEPEECINLEQYYIDTMKPEYNSNPIAGSNLGRKLSEETKLKISNSNKGKTRGLGRRNSKETKNLMSINRSDIKIYLYDKQYNLLDIYMSISDASRKLKVCRKTISKMINGILPLNHFLNKYNFKIIKNEK